MFFCFFFTSLRLLFLAQACRWQIWLALLLYARLKEMKNAG
jgi:hypothetical protein